MSEILAIDNNNDNDIEEIISKIISYKDENNQHLLSKFSISYLISLIEKDKITQMERAFKDYDKKGVDIIDFVRIFLNILEHQSQETLYLIMALVELFRIISESLNMASYLKYQDITNYICDSYIENSMDDYLLKTKQFPETKKFTGNKKPEIREIDLNAPIIYGVSEESLKRLVQNRLATDSSHHNNQSIKMGHFAKDVRKVFTLDSLSDRINMYDLDCKLEKSLMQRSGKEIKDIIILSFAWSNRQQRIGAALKDFSLVFWDAHDRFEFQKRFFISTFSNEYQTNIWYIEFLNMWLTSDRSNVLNSWDIESESLRFQLSHKKIASSIIDVIEMPVIKLVAVGSLDKLVTIWDFYKRNMVHYIDLTAGGIHSLLFFNSYQVLISAGYENSISVYQINPFYLEHDLLGKLIGHNSMVTAIRCIEKTPILISADDNGILKLWDIRSFKCVQTVDLGCKTVITKILDIGCFGKVCFLGSRLNFMDFDDSEDQEKAMDAMYAIKVEYNYLNDELAICTRKDVRFLNLETGRIKKIYKGLIRKSDDEITIFKTVEQNKKFLIGDHRGGLTIFHYDSGEKCGQLIGHSNEISSLKVDFTNKLYISAGWDSLILIQKEEKSVFEVKREIKNCFNSKEINLLDVSIYHNLMVMISNNKTIYLWDYEYCRILGAIELDDGIEPTNVAFINGYGVLLISTTNSRIFIVHFENKDQNLTFKLLSVINLEAFDKISEDSEEEPEKNSKTLHQDLPSPSIKSSELRASIRASAFLNFRKSLILNNQEEIKQEIVPEDENSEEFKEKLERKIANTANKLLIDLDYTREDESPQECRLVLGLLRGGVRVYDIYEIFSHFQLELLPHANKRMNYNAFRGAKEDFYSAVKKLKSEPFVLSNQKKNELIKLNKSMVSNFQAHKEQLTTLSIITLSEKRILSSSLDGFVKIWGFLGEKLAVLNINHPLPIVWNLRLDRVKRTRKNILFALKIVELIFRRYKRSILLSEEKNINVNTFLSLLSSESAGFSPKTLRFPPLNQEKPQQISEKINNVKLLREEYSPRDLHYENIKHIYQRELMGPSLKEMEANKQIQIAQKIWKSELESSEDSANFFAKDYLTKKFEEKASKERDAMLFYEADFREKFDIVRGYDDYSENVQKLSKKLENANKKRRANTIVNKNIESKEVNKQSFMHSSIKNLQSTPQIKKTLILPALELAEKKSNRSKTHDGPSIISNRSLNKQQFVDYASAKNLLDSTTLTKAPAISLSLSLNPAKNDNLSNIQGEWRHNFKNILRNLDKKLKKSQLYKPQLQTSLPRRNSDMLINLLENSQYIPAKNKEKSNKLARKPNKYLHSKSPRHNNYSRNGNILLENSESALNSNDSRNEIDQMFEEILRNVQEKVRKKLEVELLLRKKEWEIETKRKIMLEFQENEKIKTEQQKQEQEIEKSIEKKEQMGFEGLGRIFMSIKKF